MSFPSLDRLTLLQNFGRSLGSPAYLYRPTHTEQIVELFQQAAQSGFTIGLRGAGRSYGDASLNGGQIVLDLQRMNRILDWNPETGVIKVEPGVTIQQLWEYTLEDGWWPPVVPGTMFPTLGGCLGMNIHGKNNYVAGTIGEHVLEFTALLPTGEEITCAPDDSLFYALIGGVGVLGVFTSITLKMKRIYSGNLWVEAWASPNLRQMINEMEPLKSNSDYLVGWVDGAWGGSGLGRGQVHRAHYLHQGEDANSAQTLQREYQILPDTFFGLVPKSVLWLLMSPFMNNPGVTLVNTAKYVASRTLSHRKQFLQSLVAFNFLLDYVPNWERSYGRDGLIQYQSFIPQANAADAFAEILKLTQRRGLPNYLAVLKRHRPDKFLLSHAVDGCSMAMDFKVTNGNRAALQKLTDDLSEIVLEANGRFYFAKDSTLTSSLVARSLGEKTLARFADFKRRCDPDYLLQTELYRRLFCARSKKDEQP
jgi:FAD/FMN-containing dehydrogenase